jgi:hypothetical protein
MKQLDLTETNKVAGGIPPVIIAAGAVVGAAHLGWMIGSAIHRTYGEEIQAAIEKVVN